MNKILGILIILISIAFIWTALLLKRYEKDIDHLTTYKNALEDEIETLEDKSNSPSKWRGIASYYSEDGCVGCRADRLMANGEKFNESSYTIAFNFLPLNSWVKITNIETSDVTLAKVTDTGGFNKLGRVADLSLGVKNALNCTDLCEVIIERVEL